MTDDLLTQVQQWCHQTIAPQAEDLDRDAQALAAVLQTLGNQRLLALKVPTRWQGAGLDDLTVGRVQETIARYSGALAFVQMQHQSAGALLAHSDNSDLQQQYLPKMVRGEVLVGIAFAHLRRPDAPLKAIACPGGYHLHGEIPWITGWGIFQHVLVAATLPDGRSLYGMLPFCTTQQSTGGQFQLSPPMSLVGMPSSQTVSGQLIDWFLPDSQVVALRSADALSQSDRAKVLNHSFLALGCAQAGLDFLGQLQTHKPFLPLTAAQDTLQTDLQACRHAIYAAQQDQSTVEEKLSLRAWAIDLALRCAQTAVIAASGAANCQAHPASRIYREALVFSVAGQTREVMQATLHRMSQRSQAASTARAAIV